MAKDNFTKLLKDFVAIPSVSAQPAHAADCVKAAGWVARALQPMGFEVALADTGGHPLVVAMRDAPAGSPHIVVYGHYDVQPPEPLNLWKTKPFELTVKGKHAFGRGSSDNKGPALALLSGLGDAIKANPNLPVKITCLIEGEEEVGSKNFPTVMAQLKKQLGPIDAVVLSDTGSHSENELIITTGVRGVMAFDVVLTGLARDLHSGFGGPVPNAVRELTRVTGSLYDAQGWVTIPHFYDGIIAAPKVEIATMKKLQSEKDFAKQIGAKGFYPVSGKSPFEVNRFFPSLELNGIKGGYQGDGSKTIIPAQATAKMTVRVAPGQNPDALRMAIFKEIKKRVDAKLFKLEIVVHEKGAPAYAVPLPHLDKKAKVASARFKDAFIAIEKAVKKVTGNAPLYQREGASIPILSKIRKELGADAIMLGLFTEDSLLHSPNENINLKLLDNGRKVWREFFLGVK